MPSVGAGCQTMGLFAGGVEGGNCCFGRNQWQIIPIGWETGEYGDWVKLKPYTTLDFRTLVTVLSEKVDLISMNRVAIFFTYWLYAWNT